MAIQATAIWEVRTDGSDTNCGGGFDPTYGTPGTDYSQQADAQISYTDLVIGATNTQLTSSANPFGSAHVGNIIVVTGGTGFTQQRVQILSVSGTTATCDKPCGTANSTGGSGYLGGALASPGMAAGLVVAGNDCYIKAGTYTIASASTNIATGCMAPTSGTRFIGYSTNRNTTNTDTQPSLEMGSVSTTVMFSASHAVIINISMDGKGQTSSRGVAAGVAYRCSLANFTNTAAMDRCISCKISGCSTQPACSGYAYFSSCTSCSSTAFSGLTVFCIAYANTGSSAFRYQTHINSVAYGNTSSCTGFIQDSVSFPGIWINCIAVNNSAYGYRIGTTAGYANLRIMLNCAAYNNTSGNFSIATGVVNVGSITLTGDPFVDAANNDFRLNNTAGAGAACRAAGIQSPWPSDISANMKTYLDVGAAQHQEVAGGGLLINPGLRGGI